MICSIIQAYIIQPLPYVGEFGLHPTYKSFCKRYPSIPLLCIYRGLNVCRVLCTVLGLQKQLRPSLIMELAGSGIKRSRHWSVHERKEDSGHALETELLHPQVTELRSFFCFFSSLLRENLSCLANLKFTNLYSANSSPPLSTASEMFISDTVLFSSLFYVLSCKLDQV